MKGGHTLTQKTYLAIDLKSYYASAECAARHLVNNGHSEHTARPN